MLPRRVRVLIIGGGIHGVGILHDMTSRGWQDCLLLEKSTIGSGTSSKSSKLIHGGLRYLQNIQDFPLVSEGLHERFLLMHLAPDLVKPLRLLLPVPKESRLGALKYKIGLMLYDALSGKYKLPRHEKLSLNAANQYCPELDTSLFRSFFSYWDGQTDDLALVKRVAASAVRLGGQIQEHSKVMRIEQEQAGFRVLVRKVSGQEEEISCRYLVNCAGPWVPGIEVAGDLQLQIRGLNNKGAHILLPDTGLKSGLFLEAVDEKRIFFVLPWQGYTLVGTTEDFYAGDPDQLQVDAADVNYLLESYNYYFKEKVSQSDVLKSFVGLRWLAQEGHHSLTKTSRKMRIDRHKSEQGILCTLVGGKLTSYRFACEKIGDSIVRDFGEPSPSQTNLASAWAGEGEFYGGLPSVLERF